MHDDNSNNVTLTCFKRHLHKYSIMFTALNQPTTHYTSVRSICIYTRVSLFLSLLVVSFCARWLESRHFRATEKTVYAWIDKLAYFSSVTPKLILQDTKQHRYWIDVKNVLVEFQAGEWYYGQYRFQKCEFNWKGNFTNGILTFHSSFSFTCFEKALLYQIFGWWDLRWARKTLLAVVCLVNILYTRQPNISMGSNNSYHKTH